MNGLLLVDKPTGITSFDVVRRIRRICGTRRVGHCGTLDPLANGVLPVAVGTATRLVEFLMADEKVYVAGLQLGVVTDTQDAEGKVLATSSWQDVKRPAMETACLAMTGKIRQLPPMFSALKRDGVPLYRLARQGIEVEREPREIDIYSIAMLSFSPPEATLKVTCSKGTYIRTLCHDLGQTLGCGAHLTALRRTRCGMFTEEQCYSLARLEDMAARQESLPLLSPAAALAGFPAVAVNSSALGRLANGIAPSVSEVDGEANLAGGSVVRLMAGAELAAVARFIPGGEGGRPGDFALIKVFPDDFSSP